MKRQQTKAWLQWLAASMVATGLGWVPAVAAAEQSLTLVVMDPLAAPLSCPCVAGYAQRDYEQLADCLADAVGCPVQVVFTESLQNGGKPLGQVDLVIGKRSVVEADSRMLEAAGGPALTPVASLTDREGSPWQQGLVVVARDDPAHSLADLQTHTILLGPADSAEKHAAVRQLFAEHGRTLAADTGCSAACSDGAAAVIEAAEAGAAPVAAVISSYAQPLLEGCGTIKRGDLRVVGRTANVPFITAFLSTGLPAEHREILTKALFRVGGDPLLRLALETKQGFVPLVAPLAGAAVTPAATDQSQRVPMPATNPDWPGWRGRQRDGRVAWLPETLPARADQRWKATLFSEGVGGVAVAEGVVVVGDRDLRPMNGMCSMPLMRRRVSGSGWLTIRRLAASTMATLPGQPPASRTVWFTCWGPLAISIAAACGQETLFGTGIFAMSLGPSMNLSGALPHHRCWWTNG